ncbi:MAG: hypothetical protein ACK4RV_14775 [Caulobacter sp.]
MAAGEPLIHCVRIPKSGSTSLSRMVEAAFEGRGRFYLPDTLRREAALSAWQAFRLRRSQTQNLVKRVGVASLPAAFARIDAEAKGGELILGGHSDHGTVRRALKTPARFVTLLRDPAARALSDYNYARAGFLKKKPWQRFDAHILAKMAARYDFAGFLDYQLDHREAFEDIACAFVGWEKGADLNAWLADNLWDWGVLEKADALAARIGERTGRPAAFGRHNATGRMEKAEVSAAERTRIDRLYARDHELYAAAEAAG